MKIFTIGRKGADIVLDDDEQGVSRLHAELTVTAAKEYFLVDCGSSNGTFVKRQGAWQPVKQEFVFPDDGLRFGAVCITTLRELLQKVRV